MGLSTLVSVKRFHDQSLDTKTLLRTAERTRKVHKSNILDTSTADVGSSKTLDASAILGVGHADIPVRSSGHDLGYMTQQAKGSRLARTFSTMSNTPGNYGDDKLASFL